MIGGFLMLIFEERRRHNMRIPEKVKVLYKEYGISEFQVLIDPYSFFISLKR